VEKRFILFVVLSVAILIGNILFQSWMRGNQPPQPVAQQKAGEEAKDDAKKKGVGNEAVGPAAKKDGDKDAEKPAAEKPAAEKPAVQPAVVGAAAEADVPLKYFTLGSADAAATNPYRLLATFTNAGAAVERIEMSSPRFRDLEDRSGYLGHLAAEDVPGGVGARINVVGKGTPADGAGLKAGDVIKEVNGHVLSDALSLVTALSDTHPGDNIEIVVSRDGGDVSLKAQLGRRPLEVVRPEVMKGNIPEVLQVVPPTGHDPFSFLFTLWQADKDKLPDDAKLDQELPGVELRNKNWNGKQIDADTVEFTRTIPKLGLEFVKRYKIAQHDEKDPDQPSYHLTLELEIRNVGDAERTVAYQLDGPTGLPTEGWWFSNRISREWGGAGLRDVAMLLHDKEPALISPQVLASDKAPPPRQEDATAWLTYAGVDAQYFACALLPNRGDEKQPAPWLAQIKGVLAGKMPEQAPYKMLGDVTCRLISVETNLKPNEQLKHSYTVFAGPKQPVLLSQYPLHGDPRNNLGELIYYGWPIWAAVARPMTAILHFFYSIVGNYGIAIVMLTIMVRGCMFPLSRKQALGAQKMQALKPEMDKINEKYKGKPDEKTKAMQELWRKHNYNPMSGCMLAFLQLPIFIGLYRALMVNVELRQAPLFGESIHWASNLAAPDMFMDWTGFMPGFITAYRGMGSLGPFLNLLPFVTVGLFILQQQMFMPPATDDQTKMQQKMMKYMMILIGYMFYTVPSGLCLYIIASSIWGITEKKLLPKVTPATVGAPPQKSALAKLFSGPETNGAAEAEAKRQRRKQRGK
jgi:YidC/Oxa1 family membrane protein insertase